MSESIRCPKCQHEIPLSQALSEQLRAEFKQEFDGKLQLELERVSRRESELKRQQETLENEKKHLESEVEHRVKAEREKVSAREQLLKQQTEALERSRLEIDAQVQSLLDIERKKLLAQAQSQARESLDLELRDRDERIASLRKQNEDFVQKELLLRKEKRDLEERQREMELEIARKLDEEKTRIRESARQEFHQEQSLKDLEKDKLISDLKRNIEDLKQKAEQGSQQVQGEVLELELENLLRAQFPLDRIDPVPKGVHGGDVLHRVFDASGREVGAILWESKRTKNFDKKWLPKLRDDQRAAKAEFAAIVTTTMPEGLTTFGLLKEEGIWVSNRACAIGLATALRMGIIDVAKTQRTIEGRQGKMDLMYNYLTGPEFRMRVEGIMEAFVELRKELDHERKYFEQRWAKREKQLQRAIASCSGMRGDLEGIVGESMPALDEPDFPALDGPDGVVETDAGIAGRTPRSRMR